VATRQIAKKRLMRTAGTQQAPQFLCMEPCVVFWITG